MKKIMLLSIVSLMLFSLVGCSNPVDQYKDTVIEKKLDDEMVNLYLTATDLDTAMNEFVSAASYDYNYSEDEVNFVGDSAEKQAAEEALNKFNDEISELESTLNDLDTKDEDVSAMHEHILNSVSTYKDAAAKAAEIIAIIPELEGLMEQYGPVIAESLVREEEIYYDVTLECEEPINDIVYSGTYRMFESDLTLPYTLGSYSLYTKDDVTAIASEYDSIKAELESVPTYNEFDVEYLEIYQSYLETYKILVDYVATNYDLLNYIGSFYYYEVSLMDEINDKGETEYQEWADAVNAE